jgi:histidine triad (HIT) family protein
MYNHAPKDYKCPICLAIKGIENDDTMIKQTDVIYKDNSIMVFIGSRFVENNLGNIIIVPCDHYENFYDLSDEIACLIIRFAKKIAIAVKAVKKCDGISVRQNNEPASEQHAFHYHLHIYPRFINDGFHETLKNSRLPSVEERKIYADEIRNFLKNYLL